MSDHGLFTFYESQQGATNGKIRGAFSGICTGIWTGGCWLAHRLHQLEAFITMDVGILIYLISA